MSQDPVLGKVPKIASNFYHSLRRDIFFFKKAPQELYNIAYSNINQGWNVDMLQVSVMFVPKVNFSGVFIENKMSDIILCFIVIQGSCLENKWLITWQVYATNQIIKFACTRFTGVFLGNYFF